MGVPAASAQATRWYGVGAHDDSVSGTPGADDDAFMAKVTDALEAAIRSLPRP